MSLDSTQYRSSSPLNERRKLEAELDRFRVDGQIVSRADARRIRFLCRLSENRVAPGQDQELDTLRLVCQSEASDALTRVSRPDPRLANLSRRIWTTATPIALGLGVVAWILTASPTPLSVLLSVAHSIASAVFWFVVIVLGVGILGLLLSPSGPVKKDGTPDRRYKENRW